MNKYSDRQNYRELIAFSIEKTLSEISFSVLEKVQNRLAEDYSCTFLDCLDHPEYLSEILRDIFGNSYYVLVQSIQQNLEEFSSKEVVKNFLIEIKS